MSYPASIPSLPFVSIVIPVRDRAALLRACLESIRRLDYPRDRMEVIVVDGGSTDGSGDVARGLSAVVLPNPEKRIAPGRNIGFAATRGEIVAFTDSDCTVDSGWVRAALPYIADPAVGGVGGPILGPTQGAFARSVHSFFQLAAGVAAAAHSSTPGRIRPAEHIPTCNLIARREVLAAVFPIEWPAAYGSDLELTRRIRREGFTLLLTPDVRVWHHKRTNIRSFFRQLRYYGVGRICAARRDRTMLRAPHILAGLAIPLLLLALVLAIPFPLLLLPLAVCALVAAAAYAAWVYACSRRIAVALFAPFTLFVGVVGWSVGFLEECGRMYRKR